MNIIDDIYRAISRYREEGGTPRKVIINQKKYDILLLELDNDCINEILDVIVTVDDKVSGIIVTDDACTSSESLRTRCPECYTLSYENGYCPECGLYRGREEEVSTEEDLCDLISNQGEALNFGFGLLND
jgi:ribosomal protein L32